MKCVIAQQKILLEQSGELHRFGRFCLTRHIGTCAACRRYRDDLGSITAIATDRPLDQTATRETIESILREARTHAGRGIEVRFRPGRLRPSDLWRPALLYSAIGVLLLGAFLAVIAPVMRQNAATITAESGAESQSIEALAWEDDFDEQVAEVSELIQLASTEWTVSSTADSSGDMDDINTIASELLELKEQEI